MTDMFFEVAGWTGTILIVTAYFLISSQKLQGRSLIYHLMNLFGALGVFINVFHQKAWPAVALQVTWGIIAIVATAKIILSKT